MERGAIRLVRGSLWIIQQERRPAAHRDHPSCKLRWQGVRGVIGGSLGVSGKRSR